MVRAPVRRRLVEWMAVTYRLSRRRACALAQISESSYRYVSVKADQRPLRMRLRELAAVRVRAGYRQLHVFLRRDGWRVNHKRVYRLYREEGLCLRRRIRRRHRSAVARVERVAATAPNEQWAMDFMHDTLLGAVSIRILTVIDLYSRECVALIAGSRFSGGQVAQALMAAAGRNGRRLPQSIRVDNGTEFTSKELDHWAYWNKVRLDFSRPGKPVDNCFVEAFNGSLRRECLSQHWFLSLEDAQRTLDAWKEDYNNNRPHSSLGQLPPAEYRRSWRFVPSPERLENSRVG
jgi:putative transposase